MTTSVTLTARQRWRRSRVAAAIVALVLAASVVLAWVQSRDGSGYLDPTSTDPGGSRAIVEVLGNAGVRVHPSEDDADTLRRTNSDTTVLVTNPDLLDPDRLDALRDTGATLILVGATSSVEHLRVTSSAIDTGIVEPDCDLPAAASAGAARVGGVGYATGDTSEITCYPVDSAAALAVLTLDTGATATLLGSGDVLTNRYLDEDGNAALAMNLLGNHRDLVWFQPRVTAGGDTAATDLLPDWVGPVVVMLGVAAVVAAVWRGRRMGRLVAEPLPVVVRASETAEGRGRLYRHGRDRAHTATVLRRATVDRLRRRLRLPRALSDHEVATVAADRISRPTAEVVTILTGDPPADDAALVALADDLDTVESQVGNAG